VTSQSSFFGAARIFSGISKGRRTAAARGCRNAARSCPEPGPAASLAI
jgi:hypothetical protein